MKRTSALLALLLAACNPSPDNASRLQVTEVWAREAGPGKTVTAAYLTIVNAGPAEDVLVAVTSSTGPAELHFSSMDGNVMRMRKLERLPVPAGQTVKLAPGGTHVMLTGLKSPIPAGGRIDLTLRFEKAGDQKVAAAVHGGSGEHH